MGCGEPARGETLHDHECKPSVRNRITEDTGLKAIAYTKGKLATIGYRVIAYSCSLLTKCSQHKALCKFNINIACEPALGVHVHC